MPGDKSEMPHHLSQFWDQRQHLYAIDGVVMMNLRIVIPASLRQEVLESLHASHQGVSAMSERPRRTV